MSAARPSSYDPSARGPDRDRRRARGVRGCFIALLASVAAFALPVSPAFGEGSGDLNTGPEPNPRHGLFQRTAGVPGEGYSILYVYAQAGETIQLGSSAMGVAGAGNIAVYNPGTNLNGLLFPSDPAFANDIFDCDTDDPGTGVIAVGTAGRDQEIAGPEPTGGDADPDTWVPCEYTPTTTGIFPVIMFSPAPSGSAGVGTVGTPAQGSGGQIAIWDITVRDSADAVQSGRSFADGYVLSENGTGGGGVEVFVYTRTGYEYQVNLFDHDGINWQLRADDQGIVTTPGGERLFASFDCRLLTTDPANICTDTRAGFAGPEGRYPLFVNDPAAIAISGPGGLAATRGYAAAPITPASQPLASSFTGSGGQSGATNHGSGGTINVTAPTQMAGLGSTLEIDINRNGVWGDAPDYVDTQDLEADGSNAYAWAGRDAAGNEPACGDYQYRVRSTLAEVHFPMSDVETSGGTQIQRLTLPTDTTLGNAFNAYYDDRDPLKNRNVTDAIPIETKTTNGAISNPTFHAWGDPADPLATGGGDSDYIDTWVKLPEVESLPQTLRLLCADPQVVKTAEPAPIVPGEDATFKLAVTNNGPDAATNVSVTDDLPDTVQFESASDGCSEAGSVVTCGLASLAPGATHTFEIVVAVPSSLSECIENSATVTNTTFDTNLANNMSADCFEIKGRSNIGITKTASTATVPVGGQVMFTLVVRNNGPSDDPGVKVSDPLAAGLSLAAAKASQGSCTTTNNTLNCELGALKDGGSAQVLVTVNVTATSGCITNTARVQGARQDPDPDDNQASAQVCVEERVDPKFDLAVDKRVNVSRPRVGQRVTYRIGVTNNGPDAAPDAKVTDTYNSRATVVSVRTPQGSCTRQIPITCDLGRMEAGASLTIRVVIKPLETGAARNAASATSCCGTDTTPDNNMDTADIRVRKVTLKLSKVASRSTVRAGETLGYRIRVRNPTKGEARKVKVCDRLPSGLSYVSSNPNAKRQGARQHCWTIKRLGAGKSKTFRVTVRAARGANGRLTNTATVSSPDTQRAQARDRVQVRGVATPLTG